MLRFVIIKCSLLLSALLELAFKFQRKSLMNNLWQLMLAIPI